jgi:predicted nucleotidyltransferase
MKKVIQSILTKLPKGTKTYVFGSYLHSNNPSDIDVLVIYDEKHCLPCDAYKTIYSIIQKLESQLGYKIDLVLLTETEEKSVNFLNSINWILLQDLKF